MVDPIGLLAGWLALEAVAATGPDEFECPACGETYPIDKQRGDLCVLCNLKSSEGTL
ncbi:hypothetical protein [Halomontanus rarus]|uniref:hypothetical protein n=1 Tax=Halomontanus rarus TaxID=3034020 RepID=UPI00307CA19A